MQRLCIYEIIMLEKCLSEKNVLFLLTYSMKQSPSWKANWFCSLSRNSPHFWNPKVHYRTHKRPPPVPILSQLHQSPQPPPTSWRSILILSSHLRLGPPHWSLSLRFSNQNPVHTSPLPHTRHMPCQSHSSRFYHPNNIRLNTACVNFGVSWERPWPIRKLNVSVITTV